VNTADTIPADEKPVIQHEVQEDVLVSYDDETDEYVVTDFRPSDAAYTTRIPTWVLDQLYNRTNGITASPKG